MAKVLIAANPNRILWCNNWPHPGVRTPGYVITDRMPWRDIDDAVVFNLLLAREPDAAIRKKYSSIIRRGCSASRRSEIVSGDAQSLHSEVLDQLLHIALCARSFDETLEPVNCSALAARDASDVASVWADVD